jgi:hypothetical protein
MATKSKAKSPLRPLPPMLPAQRQSSLVQCGDGCGRYFDGWLSWQRHSVMRAGKWCCATDRQLRLAGLAYDPLQIWWALKPKATKPVPNRPQRS